VRLNCPSHHCSSYWGCFNPIHFDGRPFQHSLNLFPSMLFLCSSSFVWVCKGYVGLFRFQFTLVGGSHIGLWFAIDILLLFVVVVAFLLRDL